MPKQAKHETSISTQFLEDVTKQYNELALMFANPRLAIKSNTGLTNLKMLVLPDLKLLLGANVQWRKMDGTRSGTSVMLDASRPGADESELETSAGGSGSGSAGFENYCDDCNYP